MKWQKHKLIKKKIRESEHYMEIQDQGKLKLYSSYALTRASQVRLVVQNLPTRAGDIRDASSTPGSGRSPGGGHDNPLQCSCLENPTDRGAWWATVHGIAQSRTRLK